MSLPGHTVEIGERVASRTTPAATSNGFAVGICDRGPTDAPFLCRSLSEFAEQAGPRSNRSALLYDSVDTAFREGASAIYVGRVHGDDAALATNDLLDTATDPTLTVNAISPGAWGDDIDVAVTKSGSEFSITVSYLDSAVESVDGLASNAEAVAWALQNSSYVRIIDLSTDYDPTQIPKTQTIALAGGDDDAAAGSIGDALDLFTRDLGPGQVAAFGYTDAACHDLIRAHCFANNRRALLDLPDDTDADTLATAALAQRGHDGDRFCGAFGPWAVVPGIARGTRRVVPYSAVQMGLIARAEAQGYSPNRAAAGKLGRAQYAYELTAHFTDAERETLNDAGVNVATLIRGVVTTYGNRTCANPLTDGDWKWFSASRLVMAVAAATNDVLDDYDFDQIDGHGHIFSALQGAISGSACMPFYLADSLYGTTPAEAFSVNTGPDVNTPTTIANGEVNAQVGIRVSESAEMLTVEIVKIPTTENL